jgi:hypothetical protein
VAEGGDFQTEFGTGLRAALARSHREREGDGVREGRNRGRHDSSEPVSPELVLVSPDLRYLIVPQATALARSRRPQVS